MSVIRTFILPFALFLLMFNNAFANQGHSPLVQQAIELHGRGQYLLSSVMASWAMKDKDTNSLDREYANFLYTLDMLQLEEREEFRFQVTNYPSIQNSDIRNRFLILGALEKIVSLQHLQPEQRQRIELWKNRYVKKLNPPMSQELSQSYLQTYSSLQSSLLTNVKNPMTSGILSAMIPGLGQAYCGSFGAAALSFVINAAFGWATYDFFRNNLYGAGTSAGLITSITYMGNIMNATKTTERINKAHHREPEAKMKEFLLPELSIP